MSGWKIAGISDDSTTCEVCGRIELRSTVHLVMDDGSELRAGSSCAARKVGTTATNMRASVKTYSKNLQIARSNFPDYFRNTMGTTVEQYLRKFPQHRAVAEGMYKRFMQREGFTV